MPSRSELRSWDDDPDFVRPSRRLFQIVKFEDGVVTCSGVDHLDTDDGLRIEFGPGTYKFAPGSEVSNSTFRGAHIEKGSGVTFRDCVFDNCGNGIIWSNPAPGSVFHYDLPKPAGWDS